MPANLMVKMFSSAHGTPAQQLDFLHFLDGQEKTKTAIVRDVTALKESWKRPKWHIFAQTEDG